MPTKDSTKTLIYQGFFGKKKATCKGQNENLSTHNLINLSTPSKRAAFTLAEVLITLGIIGVVAAMTIPTLVSNYQKSQYVANFQKSYSVLNQAFKQYAADQGCTDMICTGLFSDTIANKQADWDNFFNNYLKVSKTCGTGAGCFPATENYLNYAGPVTPSPDTYAAVYKVILADGQSLGIKHDADNCNLVPIGNPDNPLNEKCAAVYLDTNGLKGPNKTGRDYFGENSFAITNKHGLLPWTGSANGTEGCGAVCRWKYTDYAVYYCGTDAPSTGYGCAARIIEEGWQMLY